MNRPEQQLHRAVVQHLTQRSVKGLVWFHPPNGGARSLVEAKIFKGLGVRAGVSDLILLYNKQFYALELKSLKGKATVAQAAFLAEVRAAGGHTAVCGDIDTALFVLGKLWGLLRGTTQ